MQKYALLVMTFGVSFVLGDILTEPIDLTYQFDNDTIYWRNIKKFEFTKKVATKRNGVFYSMNEFCAGEHGGTHLDAPYHFYEDGKKVGQIPLETLIVPGIVVDVSDDVEKNGPNTELEVKHLENWVIENGNLQNNSVILVRFGWSKFWPNKVRYFGVWEGDEATFHFPGISKKAAKWIVDTKKVVGVGVDTASVDFGLSKTFESHQILNGNGLYLLENVNIKKELPVKNFTLFIMPMKIKDGTGAPLRIVATPSVNFMKYT